MALRSDTDQCPTGHLPGGNYDANGYTQSRCFVLGTGASLMERVAPAAGGAIDGVSMQSPTSAGMPPVRVYRSKLKRQPRSRLAWTLRRWRTAA